MFLRSIVINLSMRIRFRVIYKNYVIFFLRLSFGLKRKQHLQSFLSLRTKRLLSATARHPGKPPSKQFSVSFFADYLFMKRRVNFTQDRVLLSSN